MRRARAKLGDVLTILGRYEDALRTLELAAGAYRAAGDVEGAASTLGLIALPYARTGTARDWLARAEPLREAERLEAAGCTNRGMAQLYAKLAGAFFSGGLYAEQLDVSRRAIELARALGDESLLCSAMLEEGAALRLLRRNREAMVVQQETTELAERIGELRVLPTALMHLAGLKDEAGDLAAAQPVHERAVAAATRFGDPALLCLTLSNWSDGAFCSGDWPLARALAGSAIAALRVAGRARAEAVALLSQGQLDLATGDGKATLEEAVRRAAEFFFFGAHYDCQLLLAERDLLTGHPAAARERLAPLLDQSVHALTSAKTLSLLAWAHASLGERERAHALAREATALATGQEHRLELADVLWMNAFVDLLAGRQSESARTLEQALTLARAIRYPYAEAKALYVYGQLHAARGEPGRARESYQQGLAICARLGERLYAEHIERALAGL